MNKQVIKVRLKNDSYIETYAYCVDGLEGIFAIFVHNNEVYLAAGDDGSWWEIMIYSPYWHRQITKAFIDSNFEIKKLHRRLSKNVQASY